MSIDTAKAKLQKEAKGDLLTEAIAGHLVEIMDDELAALVERPDYTANEMGRFVIAKARKQLQGKSGGLPDEVVYGYATDYYHASREEIKNTSAGAVKTQVTASPKPAKTETKPPKTVAKKPETVTKPADPVIKPPKKAKAVAEGQLSLFDLMGGFGDA